MACLALVRFGCVLNGLVQLCCVRNSLVVWYGLVMLGLVQYCDVVFGIAYLCLVNYTCVVCLAWSSLVV